MYFEAIPFFIGNGRLCGNLPFRPSGFPRLVNIQEVKIISTLNFQGACFCSSPLLATAALLCLLRQLRYRMLATSALLCLLRQLSYAYYGISLMLAMAALSCLLRQLYYACFGISLLFATAALSCLLRQLSYAGSSLMLAMTALCWTPDISQKYKMGDIIKGVVNTL
jgi:hypothetical protein